MADRPPHGEPDDRSDGAASGDGASEGTPRWVVTFGIVAALLVLLFAAVHLAGGGFRGHTLR